MTERKRKRKRERINTSTDTEGIVHAYLAGACVYNNVATHSIVYINGINTAKLPGARLELIGTRRQSTYRADICKASSQ